MILTLLFCTRHGLRAAANGAGISTGTYRRISGHWQLRIKRRGGGHRWKDIEMRSIPRQDLQRIKTEALLLGIPL